MRPFAQTNAHMVQTMRVLNQYFNQYWYLTSICLHVGVIFEGRGWGGGGACGPSTAPPATSNHHNAFLKVHIHSKCQEKGESVRPCQGH